MIITTPIPTLTLDIISNFIIKTYPDKQEVSLKTYTSLLMFIHMHHFDNKSFYKNIHRSLLRSYNFYYKKQINYSTIIKDLIKLNLIKVNNKYSNGDNSFTKSYHTTLLIDDNFSEIDINIDFGNYLTREQNLSKHRNHKKIITTTYNTKVDLIKYQSWLLNNIGTKLKPKKVNNILVDRVLTHEIAYKYIIRVLKFNLGLHWFKYQNDSGRFYSSFTTLPSSTLDFTTIRGNKVIELDIKNAQPMFLIKYIKNEDYTYDVCNGIFYQKFMSLLKKDKMTIKNLLYSKVFFNNKSLLSGELYDAFEFLYPNLISTINILKKDQLWLKLQQIESLLIFENFKSDNNCLTKHDAIIFIDNNSTKEKFNKIIEDFKKENN